MVAVYGRQQQGCLLLAPCCLRPALLAAAPCTGAPMPATRNKRRVEGEGAKLSARPETPRTGKRPCRKAATANTHCPAQPSPPPPPPPPPRARSHSPARQPNVMDEQEAQVLPPSIPQQQQEKEKERAQEEPLPQEEEEDAAPVDTAVYTAVVTMCAYETGRQESNIMAYIAPPIIARQQAALGQAGVDQVLQFSNQVYHQGVPFEPEQLAALEALCDGGKAYIKRKYGARNGCNGSRAAFMAIKQALRKQSEALAAGVVELWDAKMASMPDSFCPNFDIPKEVWESLPEGEVSYDDVFRALDSVQIPVNTSRLNVKMRADQVISGMCLGVVNARANGIVVSSFALDRPRLTELLARFARQYVPGFQFTSIQVNKNYMSAMHCDKNNLGNSYIVGVGDYTDGALWVHGQDDVQCHDQWVQFDGNLPHCTLPYTGTRYTLIYFSNQSYELLGSSHLKRSQAGQTRGTGVARGGAQSAITWLKDEAGFPIPPSGLKKPAYAHPPSARLVQARKDFRKWQRSQGIEPQD